jgi:hypothetical protein
MNGPLFAAPPSGFSGPAHQQGFQFVGLGPGDHHPLAHHGGSDFQQISYPSPGMMQMQTHPSFAAGESTSFAQPYSWPDHDAIRRRS